MVKLTMKYCPLCKTNLVKGIVDERKRFYCPDPDCEYVHWDNPVPVVAALVEHDGEIILAHNVMWPEGMYSVITGFLEKGETPEEGTLREVQEELGLTGTIIDLIGVYSFALKNQLIIAYHVKAEGEITLNEELTDFKRIDPDKLKGWSFGTGLAVEDWVKKRKLNAGK